MDSRSALDYAKKYPPVAKALKDFGHDAVLDGQVVVFNEAGKPDFDALQTYNGHNTLSNYCVFDLLWLDGYNLMALPLTDRKAILKALLADNVCCVSPNRSRTVRLCTSRHWIWTWKVSLPNAKTAAISGMRVITTG